MNHDSAETDPEMLADDVRALHEEEFAFGGRLLGRRLDGNLG